MKELSIEEKAQRYDEAIKKLHEIITMDNRPVPPKEIGVYLFPELKESEGLRIIKAIKYGLDHVFTNNTTVFEVTKEQCLSWLEAQGEHANFRNKIQVGDKVTRNRDGVIVNLSQLNRVAKKDEKQGGQKSIWHNEDEEPQKDSLILLIMQSGTPIVAKIIEPNHTFNHGERWAYIDDLLEKQGEQKPTDKVEPKFKVGDTIYYNSFGEVKSMVVANVVTDSTDNPMYEDENGSAVFEKDLVEQKPAWSEEDKNRINRLIAYFEDKESFSAEDDIVYANWLKSLKDRVGCEADCTTTKEWSEEDMAMYQGVIETEQYMLEVVNGRKIFDVGNESIKEGCTEELAWLNSRFKKLLK